MDAVDKPMITRDFIFIGILSIELLIFTGIAIPYLKRIVESTDSKLRDFPDYTSHITFIAQSPSFVFLGWPAAFESSPK